LAGSRIFQGKRFNPYPANVDKMVAAASASKWQIGFNSAFKGLKYHGWRKTEAHVVSSPVAFSKDEYYGLPMF
jgi:hypothetical protein